jgi:YVTN family beta-propeller protein
MTTFTTIKKSSLSLAAASLILLAPVTTPVFAAPAVVDTITVGESPYSVAFSPNGKTAYVANRADDTVSVITVATGNSSNTITVGDYPQSVAFSPNGKTAYVANFSDDTVSVITVATDEETSTITVGNGPQSVAFSPNGKKAYVTDLDDGTVSVIAN